MSVDPRLNINGISRFDETPKEIVVELDAIGYRVVGSTADAKRADRLKAAFDVLADGVARIVVSSPKTEHHAGKASRTIPLFAELRPILDEAFELPLAGAEYVVNEKFRQAAIGPTGWLNVNLRMTIEKFIRPAGLEP